MVLGEVCLETNDVIKLAEFYRNILKIDTENDSESKDEIHQVIITKGVGLTVYNNGEIKNNNNENISLAFTVNDVDEEYNRLLEIGVKVIYPPKIQPWGAKNMCFCDPDGNRIYFRSIPK
ncbi:glyoxalase [Spirochaetia bacterium]|nr:glyoxalase [Spirochaetia bacterium]